MRVKQLWTAVPLPAKLKLFWERVTFSRITKIYFLFSVAHCLVQVVFQVQAFTTNAKAADFLWQLVVQADTKDPGFSVFSDDELLFCQTVPDAFSTSTCDKVWAAAFAQGNSSGVSSSTSDVSTTLQTSEESSTIMNSVGTTAVGSATATGAQPEGTADPIDPEEDGKNVEEEEDEAEEEEEEEEEEDVEGDDGSDIESVVSSDDEGEDGSDIESEVSDDDELEKRDLPEVTIAAVQMDGDTEVTVNGFGFNEQTITLSRQCLYTLNYPVEKLGNTKREDITFIAFQFWVLGMSIVAILNESIPHIIASLLTHVLATGWGGFQINHTAQFRSQFTELTTNGACKGLKLLGGYWHDRMIAELASLCLNAVALLLSAFLSWRLFKAFGWQTFKRVGASRTINRVYKLVLTLSIAIQLSIFFIVVSIALWLDELCNGSIGRLSKDPGLFKGLMVAVIVLLIPWLTMGWIAVRRELRIPMMLFLVLAFGYLCGWAVMFVSPTFRWTFLLWRFFTLMTTASVILTLLTFILGIFCRANFGKGLPRYLNAEEPLPDNFVPVVAATNVYNDEEKVEFPSGHGALPTYSAAFAKNTPPSQMKFGPPRLGPRFTNPSIEPFESSSEASYSQRTAHSGYSGSRTTTDSGYQSSEVETYVRRTVSDGVTLYDQRGLSRHESVGSQRSYSSTSSAKTYGSSRSYGSGSATSGSKGQNDPFSRRWMIE